MVIINRGYGSEDLSFIMEFLRETFGRSGSFQNWFPDRFENSLLGPEREDRTRNIWIWEELGNAVTPHSKKIVGLVNEESRSHYFIQIDPSYNSLEREMINRIEDHFTEGKMERGPREKLHIHTIEGNPVRESLLSELKYEKGKPYGYLRLRPTCFPIPEFTIPEGYAIRSIRGESEYGRLTAVTRLVFGQGEWFDSDLYRWIAHRSFYKEDLDLVAVASDGVFASFCTFRMDPVSRVIGLEPVGTHPDHRGKGLAKALISEGLRRSMKYDPALFYIGGAADTPASRRLYDSVGFTTKLAEDCWFKELW